MEYLLDNPKNNAVGSSRGVAFNGRFGHLFDNEDLLMAVALHPHFKFAVVQYLNPDLGETIKKRIVHEVSATVRSLDVKDNSDQVQATATRATTSRFQYMKAARTPLLETNMDKEIERTMHSWTQLDVQDTMTLSPDMFPMEHRDIWVDLFVKYNTPVPSSAAVERLFSMGSDILKPKRSRLTAKNFEKLVFLRGNMSLLKSQWEIADSEEQDEDHF